MALDCHCGPSHSYYCGHHPRFNQKPVEISPEQRKKIFMTAVEANQLRRDSLARIIDPDAWGLYDDPRMQTRGVREDVVKDSRSIAQNIVDSGLMTRLEWDNREFIEAQKRIKDRTSRTGRCYGEEDGMDGYCLHDPRCKYWPDGASGPNSDCIK